MFNDRNAVAVVEVAVTLPFLVLIAFATLEICNLVALQQRTFRVAYDTAREVGMHDLSNSDAKDLAKRLLAESEVSGDVLITVASTDLNEFEQVKLEISAACDDAFSFANLLRGKVTNVNATAIRRVEPNVVTLPPTLNKNRRQSAGNGKK